MAHIVTITVLVDDRVQSITKTRELSIEAIEGMKQDPSILDVEVSIRPALDEESELVTRRRSRNVFQISK